MTTDAEPLSAHPGFSEIQDGIEHLDGSGCMWSSAEAIRLLDQQNNARGREIERLTQLLCVCPAGLPADFNPDPQCPIHGDPALPQLTMRGALKWRDAFEKLHARILRDLPGDGSELPQPEDPWWANQLDALSTYAAELYRQTEET